MTRPVLVVTPHPNFGELLRLSLEESGDYQVSQFESGRQALANSEGKIFALAILDSDLTDLPFPDLVRTLQSLYPGLRLIVIPPENDHAHPSLAGINPDACLNRPFYLPDMLQTVKRVLSTGDPMPEEKFPSKNTATASALATTRYAWQIDPDQATRQLASVLVESSAHAALMISQGKIWACAGSLDKAATQEISAILGRYLDGTEKGDLARFVRLNSNKSEYMVYATALVDDLVLALVFDASTPLTRIRSQVIKLARNLKQPETLPEQAASVPPVPLPQTSPEQTPEKGKSPVEPSKMFPQPEARFEEDFFGDEDEAPLEEETQISLAELLANMPSPDPSGERVPLQDWMLDPNDTESAEITRNPATPEPTLPSNPYEPLPKAKPGAVPVGAPKSAQLTPIPPSNLASAEEDSLADTQPLLLQPFNRLTDLEPVSQSYSRLTYTCLMIPRMPHHYLAGELAEHLGQWFPQCCLAFGWRLEGLSIRPEYVQWMVEVSPSISPGNMIRILRQRTSQYIFNQYSHLKSENPSGDFWAPGYLIVSGSQPPTSQMRREFLDESRRRQGLLR